MWRQLATFPSLIGPQRNQTSGACFNASIDELRKLQLNVTAQHPLRQGATTPRQQTKAGTAAEQGQVGPPMTTQTIDRLATASSSSHKEEPLAVQGPGPSSRPTTCPCFIFHTI
jgi:hypothetical protein